MKTHIKYLLGMVFFLLTSTTYATSTEEPSEHISQKAAEFLATNAKYHVVISVLVVIFIGLVVYGWLLHKKISKLEAKQS